MQCLLLVQPCLDEGLGISPRLGTHAFDSKARGAEDTGTLYGVTRPLEVQESSVRVAAFFAAMLAVSLNFPCSTWRSLASN